METTDVKVDDGLLSAMSDELNRVLVAAENKIIENLVSKVPAEVPLEGGGKLRFSKWSKDRGWCLIYVPEDPGSDKVLLTSAPRSVRIAASKALPDLWAALKQGQVLEMERVRDAIASVKDFTSKVSS